MGVKINPLSDVEVSTCRPGSPELLHCRMSPLCIAHIFAMSMTMTASGEKHIYAETGNSRGGHIALCIRDSDFLIFDKIWHQLFLIVKNSFKWKAHQKTEQFWKYVYVLMRQKITENMTEMSRWNGFRVEFGFIILCICVLIVSSIVTWRYVMCENFNIRWHYVMGKG